MNSPRGWGRCYFYLPEATVSELSMHQATAHKLQVQPVDVLKNPRPRWCGFISKHYQSSEQ